MTHLYSRPLSPEAKGKLCEFVEAYLETLAVREVDEKAEIAKAKAIEVLETDIDIALFGIAILLIFGESTIAYAVQARTLTVGHAAELLVHIIERVRE